MTAQNTRTCIATSPASALPCSLEEGHWTDHTHVHGADSALATTSWEWDEDTYEEGTLTH